MCGICSLANKEAIKAIEAALTTGNGTIPTSKLGEIANQYPDEKDEILKITDADCNIHFNFHMAVTNSNEKEASVTKDIGKDEASILYQLLGQQAATMTLLTNKINETIKDHDGDIATLNLNPITTQFYKDLGSSMRENVKTLVDLNTNLNGKKDGALEGLKALAAALGGAKPTSNECTTKEFDD